MSVAEGPHALEVAVWRYQQTVGADDRLDDERRDRVCAFVADDVLQIRQRLVDGLRILAPPLVELGRAHDAGNAGLGPPAARIAGERDGAGRRPVIRAVAREHLRASCHCPRDADGILVRLGAAVGEEEVIDVAGRD